jgi:hypothetical protein
MKVVVWMICAFALHAQTVSEWVFGGPDHRLHYLPDGRGNTVMDFSSAGYRGGGVKLPVAAVCQRFAPAPGDSTARIQAALDNATGAVVLSAGEYEVAGTLRIARSGVVLRGEKGAVIRLTGRPHCFLEIRGEGTWRQEGPPAPLLDAYVPAGSTSFRVRGASAFHPGAHVLVIRPDGVSPIDRVVDSVDGDRVTLDVPLSEALDSQFTTASLVGYSFSGRITEAGVEGLRITAAFDDSASAPLQTTAVLRMDAVEDGWARDLEIENAQNGIVIGPGAKRLTLTNIHIAHLAARSGSAALADFAMQGTQILLDRCRVTGESNWPVAVRPGAVGPLVVLNFYADHGGIAADQPWATGLLADDGKLPGGTRDRPGVEFTSAIGWSVAWNVSSPFLLVLRPPGAMNWCIGCVGTPLTKEGAPNGIFDSLGKPVLLPSLYLQQLRDRLGPDAVRNIGYADSSMKFL